MAGTVLQPPPYQDAQGSATWNEWFRRINELMDKLAGSGGIGGLSDVTVDETPVTDNAFLQFVETSETWEDVTNIIVPGTFDAEGTSDFIGTMEVEGASLFTGNVEIEAPLDVVGATLLSSTVDAEAAVTVNSTLTVTGTGDIEGAATLGSTVDIEGVATFNDNPRIHNAVAASLIFEDTDTNQHDCRLLMATNQFNIDIDTGDAETFSSEGIAITSTGTRVAKTLDVEDEVDITSAAAPALDITSTLAHSTTTAPNINLYRTPGTASENFDASGAIYWHIESSTGVSEQIGRVYMTSRDVTDGVQNPQWVLQIVDEGSNSVAIDANANAESIRLGSGFRLDVEGELQVTGADVDFGSAANTDGHVLAWNNGTETWEPQNVQTPLGTARQGWRGFATTSISGGTQTYTITESLPDDVYEIVVGFVEVDSEGLGEAPVVRLGNAGVVETTGYYNKVHFQGGTNLATEGFLICPDGGYATAHEIDATMHLHRIDDGATQRWGCVADAANIDYGSNTGGIFVSGGEVNHIDVHSPTGNFDAGSIYVKWR